MTWWTIGAVFFAVGALMAIRRRRETQYARSAEAWQTHRAASADDGIDREALEQAEREVRDLPQDVKGRPLEDVVGDDWGPGTPKPPYF